MKRLSENSLWFMIIIYDLRFMIDYERTARPNFNLLKFFKLHLHGKKKKSMAMYQFYSVMQPDDLIWRDQNKTAHFISFT